VTEVRRTVLAPAEDGLGKEQRDALWAAVAALRDEGVRVVSTASAMEVTERLVWRGGRWLPETA